MMIRQEPFWGKRPPVESDPLWGSNENKKARASAQAFRLNSQQHNTKFPCQG